MNFPASLLESPIVHRVGWALLHSVWQGLAVLALLWLSLILLRKSGAHTRYVAGLAAMVSVVALPIATFVMSPAPISSPKALAMRPPSLGTAIPAIRESQGATPANRRPPIAVERLAPLEQDRIIASGDVRDSNPITTKPHRTTRISLADLQHRAMNGLAAAAPWLVLAWLAGVMALSIWNLGAWVAVQHLKSLTTRPASSEIAAAAARLARRLGLARPVRLLQSSVIDSPLVIGMIKPVILLPASVLTGLPVAHLEALLAHELAHVLRHDYLANLLQSVAETLLFYHPAVWWISARIRMERENCCDDLAVAVTRDRTTYVRALASLAGARTPALAPAASGGELLPRLQRLMGRPDTDAVRPSRWLAGYTAAILCVVGAVSSAVHSQSAPAPTSKPATTQPAARSLHISLVDSQTGQPVPDVRGSYVLDNRGDIRDNHTFNYDANGQYTIPLELETRSLYFGYNKDGYIVNSVSFGRPPSSTLIPDNYTVRMQRGVAVGGIVEDEAGQPVAGAAVQLDFRSAQRRGLGYGHAETDRDGRWTFNGAPDNPATISVYTSHPDYIMSSFRHDVEGTRFQELREQRLISAIRRGLSISGVVHDEQGRPIANASVTPDQLGLRSATSTDDQGHFTLRGVTPGMRPIKALAPGFALAMQEVLVSENTKPIDIQLGKGHRLSGRVVDPDGKPVSGVAVSLARWRDIPVGGFGDRTDENGRFTWDSAPADVVMLAFYKEGYLQTEASTAGATEPPADVVLKPLIVVRGTVVDDQSGQPIEHFMAHAETKRDRFFIGNDAPGTNGKFEVQLNEAGEIYYVRVRAEGYLPAASPKVPAGNGLIEFNLRLRKGSPLTGLLLQPDGAPAAEADVELNEIMAIQVTNGVMQPAWSKEAVRVKTDSAGRFTFPPREGPIKALAVHDSGWVEIRQQTPAPEQRYTLHAWAKVQGQVLKGDQPLAGQKVVLQPIVSADPITRDHSLKMFFRYSATTSSDGRFVFDRVVDGKSEIYIEHRLDTRDGVVNDARGNLSTLDIQPGEQKTLQLGGNGRPLIGRLIVPQELKDKNMSPRFGELRRVAPQYIQPANYDALTFEQRRQRRADFEQTAAYRAYAALPNSFAIRVQPDGSLRADDVPAGEYVLNVNVQTPTPGKQDYYRIYASASRDVHIPEMPAGRSADPLDVGDVVMSLSHYVEAGARAPAFEARTFDGKTLKLSDLRGKYVLLDFWATWCAPCIAEFKGLEKLQHDLAGDDRFVILSISIDEHMAEPTKFLQARKLPWLQAFAGDIEDSSARRAFGIQGIPSLWLIGPDGKMIAREIDEEKVEQTVKNALARR